MKANNMPYDPRTTEYCEFADGCKAFEYERKIQNLEDEIDRLESIIASFVAEQE